MSAPISNQPRFLQPASDATATRYLVCIRNVIIHRAMYRPIMQNGSRLTDLTARVLTALGADKPARRRAN